MVNGEIYKPRGSLVVGVLAAVLLELVVVFLIVATVRGWG